MRGGRKFAVALLASGLTASPLFAQHLTTDDGVALAVQSERIQVGIDDGIATVTVDTRLRNERDAGTAGRFRFELPHDAALTDVSLWIDGTERTSERRGDATFAIADRISTAKRDAATSLPPDWDCLGLYVTPIPKRAEVRLKYRFTCVTDEVDGQQSIALPVAAVAKGVGVLEIELKVVDGRGVASLAAPMLPDAAVATDGGGGSLHFRGTHVTLAGPCVVTIATKPSERDGSDVAVATDRVVSDGGGRFVARVIPRRTATAGAAGDFVFLVDRSASMEGASIERARDALLVLVDALQPQDRFDVLSFAVDVESFGGGAPVAADAAACARAREFVRGVRTGCSTNVEAALDAARRELSDATRTGTVVLLTDGEPTAGVLGCEAVVEHWRTTHGALRLHAVDFEDDDAGRRSKRIVVDNLSGEPLGKQLADVSKGRSLVARAGAADRARVAGFVQAAHDVVLSDPECAFSGEGVKVEEIAPARRGDLSAGRPFFVGGRFRGSGPAPLAITGSGSVPGRIEVPLEFAAGIAKRPDVSQLWARWRMESLLQRIAQHDGDEAKLRDEVLRLGTEHHVVAQVALLSIPSRMAFSSRRVRGSKPPKPEPEYVKTEERGMAAGLGWIAQHQRRDGRFAPVDVAGGADDRTTEATALALLATLCNGETPVDGLRREAALSALRALQAGQAGNGCLAPADAPDLLRQHALAAIALAETYGMTGDVAYAPAAQSALAYALARRAESGAWTLPGGALDVETTAWMSLLLKSAKLAKLDVESDALARVVQALDRVTDAATGRVDVVDSTSSQTPMQREVDTAAATFVRCLASHDGAKDDGVERGADWLAAHPPTADAARSDDAYWHFGALAMFQVGGPRFDAWSGALRSCVLDRDCRDGKSDDLGSWAPRGLDRDRLGRLGATAYTVLLLGTRFRYPRVYGTQKH